MGMDLTCAHRSACAVIVIAAAVAACAPSDRSEFPLRPDDPGAQLEPEFLTEYPPEPVPRRDTAAAERAPQSDGRTVRYHAPSGRVAVLEPVAEREAPIGKLIAPSSRGALSRADAAVALDPDGTAPIAHAVPVSNTLAWPSRTMAKLFINWRDGTTGSCSGVVVGRHAVLTAAHCVYNVKNRRGWAEGIRIVPALNGTYMPFSDAWMYAAYVDPNWINYGETDDYAIITTTRNIGDATGWMSYYVPSDSDLTGFGHQVQGYPGGSATGLVPQHFAAPAAELVGNAQFQYDFLAEDGTSGSGVRSSTHGTVDDLLEGVHFGPSPWRADWSIAERITVSRYDNIRSWIAADASWPAGGQDFANWDLRVNAPRTYHAPTAVARVDTSDRMFLLLRATDGNTWAKAWTGAGWSSLVNIGGITTHQPVGISRMPGHLDVFVRGADGQIWTKARSTEGAWSPSVTGWDPLPLGNGEPSIDAPAVTSSGANRLDVFMVGEGGGLYWQYWAGAGRTGWQRINSASDTVGFAGSPAAVVTGPNRIDVVVMRPDQPGQPSFAVHFHCSGACASQGDWVSDPAHRWPGAPAARRTIVSPSPGRFDVFYRGLSNEIMHAYYDGTYADAEFLVGTIRDDVAAVSRRTGQIDIFFRDSVPRYESTAVVHQSWNAASPNPWTSERLGCDILGTPSVVSRGPGNLEVFVRTTVNSVRSRRWAECGLTAINCGWTPFSTPERNR